MDSNLVFINMDITFVNLKEDERRWKKMKLAI